MNLDERLEALTMNLELASRDIEAMRATAREHARETSQQLNTLLATAKVDGENIRALARIAEIHERRITHLEGGE
jgi:hypothetical protein